MYTNLLYNYDLRTVLRSIFYDIKGLSTEVEFKTWQKFME